MDRLHLQPARRLDCHGEELLGALDLDRIGRAAQQALQLAAELGILRRDPAGETIDDTLGHLGRRGLRVGQAQDAIRRGSRKQQAQHTHGEYVRLARSGICRDPG